MVNIKEIRKKTNLSQREFALKYDIPLRTIQKWEQGGSTPPDYIAEMIEKLYFSEKTELYLESYWRDEKTAIVRLDDKYAYIDRLTLHPAKQIFYKDKMTRLEFCEILEDRCWDRKRDGIDRLLNMIGLEEYNPYAICRYTHGKMYQDNIWFRYPGEIITYNDIRYM